MKRRYQRVGPGALTTIGGTRRPTIEEVVGRHVQVQPDGCWLYNGQAENYGVTSGFVGWPVIIHRFIYEILVQGGVFRSGELFQMIGVAAALVQAAVVEYVPWFDRADTPRSERSERVAHLTAKICTLWLEIGELSPSECPMAHPARPARWANPCPEANHDRRTAAARPG